MGSRGSKEEESIPEEPAKVSRDSMDVVGEFKVACDKRELRSVSESLELIPRRSSTGESFDSALYLDKRECR